jgi:hypothetical protein
MPRFITEELVCELVKECGFSEKEAYSMLLAAAIGLEIDENPHDRALWSTYLPHILRPLDVDTYRADPYLRTIRIPERTLGAWRLGRADYLPYEAFVCDDFRISENGRVYPQIGYFKRAYSYPVVYQNEREWMLITPNEIETMREPIAASRGRVLTFGLGLGYFAFMASRKKEVEQVTVVERDPDVIRLFRELILPQFRFREKLRIVCDDAFSFAENEMQKGSYDVVFTDLWHDVGDGLPLYRRMRSYEDRLPQSRFLYWIEKTMRCYEKEML